MSAVRAVRVAVPMPCAWRTRIGKRPRSESLRGRPSVSRRAAHHLDAVRLQVLVQAHLFSGFGWGAVAYSQGPDLPFVQLAAIGGAAVVICYGVAYVKDSFRIGFFDFAVYRIVFTLVSLGVGVYFAVNRLR